MKKLNKDIALRIVGFLIILLLIWFLAIDKTISLKEELNHLKKHELINRETPKKLSLLMKKRVMLDSALSSLQLEGKSIQNNLLSTLNKATSTSTLKIISFSEPHHSEIDKIRYTNFQFELQGEFNDIQKIINELENSSKYGRISHIAYSKKKNYRTNKFYLTAKIIIERLS